MTEQWLEDPEYFRGEVIERYELRDYVGRGETSVVYVATRADIQDRVACKLILSKNLKREWQTELERVNRLAGVPQVVSYRRHGTVMLKGKSFAYICWEWVEGEDLRRYVENHPSAITLDFILHLADEILQVFYAMQQTQISHDALHEGNIIIANDTRIYDRNPIIKITDFGIERALKFFTPIDDYEGLSRVCCSLLSRIDPSNLDGRDHFVYERFLSFLDKEVLERDPTVGDYVRNPQLLIRLLRRFGQDYDDYRNQRPRLKLKHPFDYWSCEQIGEDFELLAKLYSLQFLGNRDLVERTNTVLTGPRGCGKTTIFRNLSLKTQLLAKIRTASNLDDYIGIYYQCKDLYNAFTYLPYLGKNPSNETLQITVHYFNLALLLQILDTLVTVEEVSGSVQGAEGFTDLEKFLKSELIGYEIPPAGTSRVRHMLNTIRREKLAFKQKLESGQYHPDVTTRYLALDFLKRFCGLLQEVVPWLKNRPFYFFLDDYSLPKISRTLQLSLNRIIFDRSAECFFKVSTESVVTLHPYDADGKFLEEAREYDLIDLGSYFLHGKTERRQFLIDVINNRLNNADSIHEQYKSIEKILGKTPYTYNGLAQQIAKGKHVYYHGVDTLIDLCSGDIANILQLLRDMFAGVKGGIEAFSRPNDVAIPIDRRIQDRAIREFGNNFLNKVESLPQGRHLRNIVEAFGEVANWYLCNRTSKNLKGRPQWQAFRIEIREKLELDKAEIRTYYDDLIRYGVFIRDVRGKSQRGAVVDRLYLRRVLIPTFLLTFNQRDNIGLEPEDFKMLLERPEQFAKTIKVKVRVADEQRRML